LVNDEKIKALFDCEYYTTKVLLTETNIMQAVPLDNLCIKSGYAYSTNIEAGDEFKTLIEIDVPYSILYVSFATEFYDIGLKISRLTSFQKMREHEEDEPFIFVDFDKVDVCKRPCRIITVMKIPGIYEVTFSNVQSWFRGKELAYRVNVLEPKNILDMLAEEVQINKMPVIEEMFILNNNN